MKKTYFSLFLCSLFIALMNFGCKIDLTEDNYLERPDVVAKSGYIEIRGRYINSNTDTITIFRQDVQSSTNTPVERVAIFFMEGIEDPSDQTFIYNDERVISGGEYRYYLIFQNKDGTRNRTKWSDKKLISVAASGNADIAFTVTNKHYEFNPTSLELTLEGSGSITAPGNTVIKDIDDYDPALVFQAGDRIQVFKIGAMSHFPTVLDTIDLRAHLPEYYYNKEVTLLGIVGQKIETNSSDPLKIKCVSWTKITPIDVKDEHNNDCNPFTLELKFGKEHDVFDYSTNADNEI